jgi:hypothetical protein
MIDTRGKREQTCRVSVLERAMGRRQLLLGLAATALAGQANLGPMLSAQTPDAASPTRATVAYSPVLYLSEPRGPVKTCIEEITLPNGSLLTNISEYTVDGKLVSSRSERDGQIEDSTNDDDHAEVRDAQGRLLKSVSENSAGVKATSFYTYDSSGRILTITNSENSDRTEYNYAPDGAKTAVRTFDPKTLQRTSRASFGGSPWRAVELGFGVPIGGTVITTYDKNNNETETRVVAADGQILTQIVRKYDSAGRLLEEKPVQLSLGPVMLDGMPPKDRARLTPEQMEVRSKRVASFAVGEKPSQSTYTYDALGRVIQALDRNQTFEKTKTIRYNDYGDRIEERTAFKNNSKIPIPLGVPYSFDDDGNPVPSKPGSKAAAIRLLPPDTRVQYTYQYDSHGNWTERIEMHDNGYTETARRTLTYY